MIKNIFISILLVTILISCNKNQEGAMTVQGSIYGLQKGTLYLQKMQDTLLISVDSITLKGENNFTLYDQNVKPELYYLTLKEKNDERISFFGEKGIITINTKLDKFTIAAKIDGSDAQKLLEEYKEMIGKFNDKRLDLMKETFEAQTTKDDELIEKLDKDLQRLIKKRYLYSTNFSVKNAKSEVAPYIALTELYNANVSLLDTINNSLSKKVKASKYGKKLDAFIKDIKENEK